MRLTTLIGITCACALGAQEPNPTQRAGENAASTGSPTPIYRVNVVAHTTKAVNYGHRSAPTKIDFEGTVLLPHSKGEAQVRPNSGAVEIRAKFRDLEPPHRFGRQYLTYVLWAITPEGRATNLGEILADDDNDGKLQTATELQTFALMVTAEPYFAVTQPSDVVVMENVIRPDTLGRIQTVDAKYELLKRGEYTFDVGAANRSEQTGTPKVSMKEYEALLGLYQARNAVQMAKAEGAAEHAGEALRKAEQTLSQAQAQYDSDPESKRVVTLAREAAQMAEDARLITLRRKKELDAAASHRDSEPNPSPIAATFKSGNH